MPKKKPSQADPEDTLQFDQAAADQMAGDRPSGGHRTCPPDDKAAAANEQTGTETDALKLLQAELQVAKDRALRSQAELENYRKRAAREMREERRYANLPLLRDLLPVLDNMERAIEAAEKTHDAAGLLEGVKMVSRQLEGTLAQHDCVRIEATGEPFDPHRHEAISQQASDEHPDNTVLLETQTGFRLHDRVVRPSQVIVSTANQQDRGDKDDERNHQNADL